METTRNGSFSVTPAFDISVPNEEERRARAQTQELRQILQDLLFEYHQLQNDWIAEEKALRDKCEAVITELRDVETKLAQLKHDEQAAHLEKMATLRENHAAEIAKLHAALDGNLNTEGTVEIDDLDYEIEQLQEALKEAETTEMPETNQEEDPPGSFELEEIHEDLVQKLDEAQRQSEDASKDATRMVEEVYQKQRDEEAEHEQQLQALFEELSSIDEEGDQIASEAEKSSAELKTRREETTRQILGKIAEVQRQLEISKKTHQKEMSVLSQQVEELRSKLETTTQRQRQQLQEGTQSIKKFREEKKRVITLHKEIELLNNEFIRENIEHQTLLRELGRLDTEMLSQTLSGSGRRTLSSISTLR